MRKSDLALAAAICACEALSVSAARAQATLTGMAVKRHSATSGTDIDARVNNTFAFATNALRNDRGAPDQLCPLTLFRHGNINTTNAANVNGEVINNADQLAFLNDSTALGWMIVVNGIFFCGSTVGQRDVCAPFAFGSFMIDDNDLSPAGPLPAPNFFSREGNLLAHGFAGTVGLVPSMANSLLEIIEFQFGVTDVLASDTGVRNCDHCDHYFRTNFGTGLSPLIFSFSNPSESCTNVVSNQLSTRTAGTCSDGASRTGRARGRFQPVWRQQRADRSQASQGLTKSIVEYATQVRWSQIPTNLHEVYSQADADQLRALLKDDALVAKNPKILSVLGLVSSGMPEDVEALSDYFQRSGAAVEVAGMALGYVAARADNQDALDFLLDQSGASDVRTVQGALYGLALSGKPEALPFIRERRLERAAVEPRSKARFKASYDDAERANLTIATQGLKGYYGH